MSCSTTTITNFRYNILLVHDLWSNEPLPPLEYPPPPSRRLFFETPVQENSFITQEDPLNQPRPPSHPVHVAASYADISERLTRFEQQCFK
ncbi:hypothetical protein GOBAR_AA32524 [Gossypium barbadense]|uniref:Uncharacterized protein n=1 Tax=Gossypium barbadense TaxID=3634 RepID=A0A2P5WAQ1_GOSBA|nr:hypothetical protein GOBAR_AA32524 [Gossypium barbadense]